MQNPGNHSQDQKQYGVVHNLTLLSQKLAHGVGILCMMSLVLAAMDQQTMTHAAVQRNSAIRRSGDWRIGHARKE
jgi:hypothetical protein